MTLSCPRCGQGLLRYQCEDVQLVRCWGGHGVWIDNALSQRLARGDFPDAVLRELAGLEAHAPPAYEAEPLGGCPECRAPMLHAHAQVANVGLDVCKPHGTWLDSGELARVARGVLSPEPTPAPEPEKAARVPERRLPNEHESRENTKRLEALVSRPDEGTYAKGLRVLPGVALASLFEFVVSLSDDDDDGDGHYD